MSSWEEEHSSLIYDLEDFNPDYWETRHGTLILVSQMSTQHIKNCIKLIKKYNWRTHYLNRLQKELNIRNGKSSNK